MRALLIKVANKVATYVKGTERLVCGNSDFVVEFVFDSEWFGREEKTARFIWNGQYQDVTFTGTTCPVPVLYRTDEVRVGVYAGDLCSTTSAVIPCLKSVLCGAGTPHDENEPQYISDALEAAEEAKQAAEEAKEAADAAQSTALKLEGSASGAIAVLTEVSPTPHTVRVQVEGESSNLIPYPFTETTKTEDGVTFTDNGDGTVTLTGTHGGNSPSFTLGTITIKESGNYYLSGCPDGGGNSSYALVAWGRNGNSILNSGGSAPFYANAGEVFEVTVNVTGAPAGATFNVTFKPRLEVGESASGASVVASGKNLFDTSAERGKIGSYTGIDITHIAEVFGRNLWLSLKLKDGKSVPQVYFGFAFTLENANPTANWVLTPTGGVVEKGLKIPNWYDQVGVCAFGNSNIGINGAQAFELVLDAFDVQLEVGTTKTDYEPFSFYEEYTADENGVVEIPSRSPHMVIAPKDTRLMLSATYNRDLSMVIAKLEKALGLTAATLSLEV